MGHPRRLLDDIAAHVTRTWPTSAGYVLHYERSLKGARRMMPDIQVVDSTGVVRCVVEIGYTRPEKLKAYRELGIADVRWYDKQGILHPVIERIREIERRAKP